MHNVDAQQTHSMPIDSGQEIIAEDGHGWVDVQSIGDPEAASTRQPQS